MGLPVSGKPVIRPLGFSTSFNAVSWEPILARIHRFATREGEFRIHSSAIRRMMHRGKQHMPIVYCRFDLTKHLFGS